MRFKTLRIIVLLLILIAAAFYTKTQRLSSRTWIEPLEVVVYPLNGEHSPLVDQYIQTLDPAIFSDIDRFFEREADFYQLSTPTPFRVVLGPALRELPPEAPPPDANVLSIVFWGLKLRYWAYRHTPDDESNLSRVRVFLHYHEAEEGKKLQHSLGLDKGLLSVVHVFAAASQQAQNNIVIAHELLHTVGASDKYGGNGLPVFPDGYAEPERQPRYPQQRAEIMAGRIPLSSDKAVMAESLEQCIIGAKTAGEIDWAKPALAD